jgi:hypothetical protein
MSKLQSWNKKTYLGLLKWHGRTEPPLMLLKQHMA